MTDRPLYWTPQQHRDRAEYLRLKGTPEALHWAMQHELLAKALEKRLELQGDDYPLAPR